MIVSKTRKCTPPGEASSSRWCWLAISSGSGRRLAARGLGSLGPGHGTGTARAAPAEDPAQGVPAAPQHAAVGQAPQIR